MALTTQAYGLSDVGRKRSHNEDAMLVDAALGLYVVADGMGGHAAGEVASAFAAQTVKEVLAANRQPLEDLARDPTPRHRLAAALLVESAVQKACSGIYRWALADPSKRGMGTTFVCLAMAGAQAVIGHVGDSRVYLVRGGRCHRLTEDHTLVAAQVKAGRLTREQAASSQYRNVITRAVGIQESVQVDTLIVDLMPDDVILLCSDGLHGYLQDDELPPLTERVAPKDLPDRLIDLANERGGKDNITVVALAVQGDDAAAPELAEAHSRLEALRGIPIFRHLTYKEQMAVLAIASTRTYPAGCEVFAEGHLGEELFVVLGGRVSIEKNGIEVAEVKTGGHFGEMGLVDNAPRSATVRTLEATAVMVIARPELIQLMKRESLLAVKMLWSFVRGLSNRLRTTTDELSEARQELAIVQAVQPFAEE